MKKTFLLFAALALSTAALAQEGVLPPAKPVVSPTNGNTFVVGTNVLNVGLGFGASWYNTTASATPAFSVSYERGLLELGPVIIGAGAYIGFQRATTGNAAFFSNGATNLFFAVRGALHYPATNNLDLYGGLGLGLRNISLDQKSLFYETSNTDLVGSAIVGGRYYFTEKTGAFAELGYDQTYFKAGAALKF